MRFAPLIRRREVWLPTWRLVLLLLVAAVAIAGLLGRHAYALLAPTEPAPGARTLVVEGWLEPGDLRQVAAVVRAGRYERVLTTGLPLEPWDATATWRDAATRSAAYLVEHGVADVPVIAVPASNTRQERTYRTALAVRDWAARTGTRLDAIDLLSSGAHMRRSRAVYRLALGASTQVGAIAVPPAEYDGVRWWTTSEGAKRTMGEMLSLAWTTCCFWP
mgnify:CR=1 FL=1